MLLVFFTDILGKRRMEAARKSLVRKPCWRNCSRRRGRGRIKVPQWRDKSQLKSWQSRKTLRRNGNLRRAAAKGPHSSKRANWKKFHVLCWTLITMRIVLRKKRQKRKRRKSLCQVCKNEKCHIRDKKKNKTKNNNINSDTCHCNVSAAVMFIILVSSDPVNLFVSYGMFSCQSCRCWREHNRRTRGHRTKGSRGWRRCSKRRHWRDVGSNGIQSSGRIWEQASTEGTLLFFIHWLLIDSKTTAIFTGCNSLLFVCWQVHRVLPQWLAQPDMIHRDIKSNLVPLADVSEISAKLVKKLHNNGIQHLFPGNIRFRSIVDILKLWQE